MEPPNGTPPPSPSPPPQRPSSSAAPVPPLREDCWTEDSTFALIHAWGDRYLALDRGNFSQQDWQDVADSVNSRPRPRPPRRPRRGGGGGADGDPPSSSPSGGSSGKACRTGIQCKNRIDTLKKKFKVEKARVSDPRDGPGGGYLSPWPFFADLDALIGSNFPPTKPSPSPTPPPAAPAPARSRAKRAPAPQPARSALPAVTVPVRPRSHNRTKRAPARPPAGGSLLRPAFSAAAAAAAADEEESESEPERSSSRRTKSRSGKGGSARRERGYAELAVAIERLGQIYERVERKKAREMIELEKQRMQFAKDLEQQRMRWFLETQIHLQKIKKLKQTPIDESYL